MRRRRPFLTGKCLVSPLTSRRGASSTGASSTGVWLLPIWHAGASRLGTTAAGVAVSTIGPLRNAFGMPASGPMIRTLLLIGREPAAARVVGEGTPRRERARLRQIAQRRYD